MMKRIITYVLAGCPFLVSAHPCPFDWNIKFSKRTEIRGKNISDFANQFNEAVRVETKGKIKKAIVIKSLPDTFTKVPENSAFSEDMDTLIRRYAQVTAPLIKKGVSL